MAWQRAAFIVVYYAFLGLSTLRGCLYLERTPTDVWVGIAIATGATFACIADSRLRNQQSQGRVATIPFIARFALFFLWPIAVPVYLLTSRGWRGLIPIAAHLLCSVAVLVGITWLVAGVLAVEAK